MDKPKRKFQQHQYQLNQQVRLPGTQFRTTGYGYANKFLWDETGTITARGWNKDNGEPIYKVNGKWRYTHQVRPVI